MRNRGVLGVYSFRLERTSSAAARGRRGPNDGRFLRSHLRKSKEMAQGDETGRSTSHRRYRDDATHQDWRAGRMMDVVIARSKADVLAGVGRRWWAFLFREGERLPPTCVGRCRKLWDSRFAVSRPWRTPGRLGAASFTDASTNTSCDGRSSSALDALALILPGLIPGSGRDIGSMALGSIHQIVHGKYAGFKPNDRALTLLYEPSSHAKGGQQATLIQTAATPPRREIIGIFLHAFYACN